VKIIVFLLALAVCGGGLWHIFAAPLGAETEGLVWVGMVSISGGIVAVFMLAFMLSGGETDDPWY